MEERRTGCETREVGRLTRERGFTLIELLVATLVGGVVVAAAVGLLRTHGSIARRSQSTVAAIGAAAWAVTTATRDVELAGADPMGTGLEGLAVAERDRVVLHADRDGDGAVDPSSAERVTLAWRDVAGSGTGRVMRQLGGQSMAIAEDVAPGDFRLRYFAADGAEIATPGAGGLGPAERASVRRVTIDLAVTVAHGDEAERIPVRDAAALRTRAASAP